MPATSEARINANRQNSLKSTGPKTPEGKEISRRNGLKHGLAGAGVVVLEADAPIVERRNDEFMAELNPKSRLGQALVGQMATLSVRMERSAEQEELAIASRVRNAIDDFDHERVDRVEALFDAIADDPRGHLRKLKRMPEGVDRLVEAWNELRDDLTWPGGPRWDDSRRELVAHLLGLRFERARGSRVDSLSMALLGETVVVLDPDFAGLDHEARRAWARDRLVERVDEEVAALEEHRETFDLEAIELDRIEAPGRALFDPSPRATLARRYEAAARRGFYKALAELRQVEAVAANRPGLEPALPPERPVDPTWESNRPLDDLTLASSREILATAPRESHPAHRGPLAYSIPPRDGAARGLDGRVIAIGRAVVDTR